MNWTWSHCIGLSATNISNLGAVYPHQPYQNNGPQDRHLDMGDCTGNSVDIRHIVNVTPWSAHRSFDRAWVRRLATGWNFSTIYTCRSGPPVTAALNASSDNALNGFAPSGADPVPQRPNQILPDVICDQPGTVLFAGSLRQLPQPQRGGHSGLGTYGNMGVSTLRAPGFWEWDQAITRQFPIRETMRLEFRAEAFNVTNSVRFGAPNATLSGTYGQITSDQATTGAGTGVSAGTGGRIIQFAIKFLF